MILSILAAALLCGAPAEPVEVAQADEATPPATAPTTAQATPDAGKPGLDVSKLPFTPYSIQEVVKSHLAEVQDCYNGVVLEMGKQTPSGKVLASFRILPSGLTDKVTVNRKKSTIKNQRIQECVTEALRNWQFPKPEDGRVHPIEYPFNLSIPKEK
jgi:hypothetical protein